MHGRTMATHVAALQHWWVKVTLTAELQLDPIPLSQF